MNDFDAFFIQGIFDQQQTILQALLSIDHISSTDSFIGKDNNKETEYSGYYALHQFLNL